MLCYAAQLDYQYQEILDAQPEPGDPQRTLLKALRRIARSADAPIDHLPIEQQIIVQEYRLQVRDPAFLGQQSRTGTRQHPPVDLRAGSLAEPLVHAVPMWSPFAAGAWQVLGSDARGGQALAQARRDQALPAAAGARKVTVQTDEAIDDAASAGQARTGEKSQRSRECSERAGPATDQRRIKL